MSNQEIARIGLYMSPELKDKLDARAKQLHKRTSVMIVEWCDAKINGTEIDVEEAIKIIKERLDALEAKVK